MTRIFIVSFLILLIGFSACNTTPEINTPNYTLVIHGGAGYFNPDDFSVDQKSDYENILKEAIFAGEEILKDNGNALDAVEAAIRVLEDSPLFNAGKGAVFTHEGTNELDASIMNGSDLNVESVAGVKKVKNPITAARAVMEKSKHVMLSGSGADKFAIKIGLDTVSNEYFFTQEKYNRLQKILEEEANKKLGTVGCVAFDMKGNLAAGTSTGGMSNKMFGRIGDSPIAGCGSYANNNTCGISFTGHGEYIIRYTAAHDISALMEYKNMSLRSAMELVINKKLKENGGSAGAIGIDSHGNIEMIFNTPSMFRAYLKDDGTKTVLFGK